MCLHAHACTNMFLRLSGMAHVWKSENNLQGTDHVDSCWSQSHRDQISSASRLLGFKTCATMPDPSQNIPSI